MTRLALATRLKIWPVFLHLFLVDFTSLGSHTFHRRLFGVWLTWYISRPNHNVALVYFSALHWYMGTVYILGLGRVALHCKWIAETQYRYQASSRANMLRMRIIMWLNRIVFDSAFEKEDNNSLNFHIRSIFWWSFKSWSWNTQRHSSKWVWLHEI